ncbi:metallo-beta-lactamase superfamily protein [Chlamydia ibidis]|uniref:Metallo-beta-lactamase superfamily protein n=2 Tax=Chlamydia ibidis TaxID=1405396 RepID=S7J352_9CHLA|nr:MBL fold metallo-hydrolase [Chlamydia ibidis]EPP34824.1 metallo-beta-lactamase superfamily protein [Chlamydia ibidis]EQM62326.1 metallo-beta-lactamase superfamily protein [Chlamydia ibidis 10-1398/6]
MEGFFPLASGSKGNCTYLGTASTKILIDLGISKQQVTRELRAMDIHPEDIQAIFVSHEHSDHISGIKSFIKTYNTPIVCNLDTARNLRQILDIQPNFHIFSTGTTFSFHDLKIRTFNVSHDTVDPVGYVFHYHEEKLGFCTDLGCVTSWITHELYDCDYLIIESNHDPEMVQQSRRAEVYKKRVLSKLGHISNQECGFLLQKVLTPKIKRIYLAHLSNECNTPELALSVTSSAVEHIASFPFIVAKASEMSEPTYFSSLINI